MLYQSSDKLIKAHSYIVPYLLIPLVLFIEEANRIAIKTCYSAVTTQTLEYPLTTLLAGIDKAAFFRAIAVQGFLYFLLFYLPYFMREFIDFPLSM